MAILVFFFCFMTTRKAQCQGILLPVSGVIRVVPTQTGTVKEKRVREGQLVAAGDVLFVLSGERSAIAGDAQKTISSLLASRRDSYRTELQQLELQTRQHAEALRRRMVDITGDLHHLDDQITLQKQRVSLSEQAWKRYSGLQALHYISAAQSQDKQADLLDQRQRVSDLLRAKANSQRDVDSTDAELRNLSVQAARDAAALQRNIAMVEEELTDSEAKREILVRSPGAGVVTAITAEMGQTVSPSQSIASVLPAHSLLEAEIYAPSRSVGFVKPGMQVLLRYQAYPYQKFGQHSATVTEVANTSLRPEEMTLPGATLPPGSTAEPLYRIRLKIDKQTVKAYGTDMPLKSGMLLDASIVLERRHLYEWILEPLFSISGRI
ncbi:HlyD family secretion protein [Massilia putida]|uniref:HlyD family secretion protein n=1 Tax=Massilia putida TaxID=1141883 RepID=UPI001E3F357E|nr:HlyD family efflux transporter periplasmic adaptor subunit [Massilia putida]